MPVLIIGHQLRLHVLVRRRHSGYFFYNLAHGGFVVGYFIHCWMVWSFTLKMTFNNFQEK